jgi:hypothetical protein
VWRGSPSSARQSARGLFVPADVIPFFGDQKEKAPAGESGLSISSQRIRARKRASFITVIAQARFGTMRTSSAFCEPLRHIYAWRCLRNLGRFVDNPWAIPGHIELANGQIQATNQAGINLKYPFSAASTTSSVSSAVSTVTTRGSEFDLNPAQTQDQESYNILPVTDPDDLRRLRAIYHYAICPDIDVFAREWEIADQYIFRSLTRRSAPSTTPKPAATIPSSPASAASRTVEKARDRSNKRSGHSDDTTANRSQHHIFSHREREGQTTTRRCQT